jgi:hypothetical protein
MVLDWLAALLATLGAILILVIGPGSLELGFGLESPTLVAAL